MADKLLSTTRISDLPENITMQMAGPVQPSSQQYVNQPINTRQPLDMGGQEHNFNYTQMNVHPNPYGNPNQPSGIPLPPPPAISQQMPIMQDAPSYKLPSRDIPRNTDVYTQDIETTANYIPPPKLTSDYIRDFQNDEEVSLKTHKEKKRKERLLDILLTEIQLPIFMSILFFVFQMPLVDAIVFKKFSFFKIYSEDGHFNFYGLFIKSVLFGVSYIILTRTLDIVSSL